MATVTRYFCLHLTSVLLSKYVCSYTHFFYKNVVCPAQAEYSYFSADFRLKILLYYSYIIAYDISVLEFIGVSITGYKCLVSGSVSRYTLQSARPRCYVKQHLTVLALKKAFRTEIAIA